MIGLLLLAVFVVFLSYKNAELAQKKGQNTILWAVITGLAFCIAYFFATIFLILLLYRGEYTIEAINQFVTNRPLLPITVLVLGVGGYLVVRFILEKMPDKKDES